MPHNLKRYQQTRQCHFVTFSCCHRRPLLRTAKARDLFLSVLEATRKKFAFVILGYVVMPEHVHLLISELEQQSLALALQMLKQNSSRRLRRHGRTNPRQQELFAGLKSDNHFWQKRYYDFNVWTEKKRIEKLKYMHRNPMKRGLVTSPEDWRWSSYRSYALGEAGPVTLNAWQKINLVAQT